MKTYQDFIAAGDGNRAQFISAAITDHKASDIYLTALDANAYDRQKNVTINDYVRTIYTISGSPVVDFTAANNRIASNFFHRLNTQRCTYSLGNGVTFSDDKTKTRLGAKFDTQLKKLAYYSLIHGIAFGFWNLDRLHVFPVTEFVPLWDEYTGAMRAGIRFWQLSDKKPFTAVLYEEDGYTKYTSASGSTALTVSEAKRAYVQRVKKAPIDSVAVIVGEENYSTLPIIPLWGSNLHQSTLVGMKEAIDSYDLIQSGFANDLNDCAQIYWLVKNAGGMTEKDLANLRERLRINHMAVVDSDDGGDVQPYTQDIPYQARQQYLSGIRSAIYEAFGALDVHTVAAGATNDHIDAAYQPMDENADDFEYEIIDFVQQVLALIGIDDTPLFKRNRISNEKERTEMILAASEYIDAETVLNKLPFITPDEIPEILKRRDADDVARFQLTDPAPSEDEDGEAEA